MNLQTLLDEEYEANAKWVMSKTTWGVVRKMVDGAGRPLVQSSVEGVAEKPRHLLLGAEVVIDNAVPVIDGAGLVDTFILAYGDLEEAYAIRRIGSIVVMANPYSRQANGEVEYTAWERADGQIKSRNAYVIGRNNT